MGKLGLALLPLEKLKQKSPRGVPFEKELHEFLFTTLHGYTVSSGNISGHWRDDAGHDHYGEHRAYKVALPSPEALQLLQWFLATLAFEMHEQCIYLERDGEVFLISALNPEDKARAEQGS